MLMPCGASILEIVQHLPILLYVYSEQIDTDRPQ